MSPEGEELLRELYFEPNSPVVFSSPQTIWRYIRDQTANPHRLTLTEIKRWVAQHDVQTLFSFKRTRFIRRKVIVPGPDHMYDGDVMDMRKFSRNNRGMKYLMVYIDVFSRMLYLDAMADKSGPLMADKTEAFLTALPKIPKIIRTDAGKEYVNGRYKELMDRFGIYHQLASHPHKSNYAERAILYVKRKLYKLMHQENGTSWVDHMRAVQEGHNAKRNAAIGMAPSEVGPANQARVWNRLYMPKPSRRRAPPRYKRGDFVRILKPKETFLRGYKQRMTDEIFLVGQRIASTPYTYVLVDLLGKRIKGVFYEAETTLIPGFDPARPEVSKVIRRRRGMRLVQYRGFPERHKVWIR